MRPLIFTLAFLLASQLAIAQYPIHLADNDPTLDIAQPISIIDVVDFRKDTLSIGFIQAGAINNRLQVANLDGGAANAIKKYIQNVMPQAPGTASMAMVIKELRIYEDVMSMKELARLHVNYEFYSIKDREFNLALSFTRDYNAKSRNITAGHEANVRQSIREALLELANTGNSTAQTFTTNNGIATGTYSILKTQKPVRGIYRSLEEFRNNTPSIQRDFEIHKRSHAARILFGAAKNELYYKDENGKRIKIEEPVWGFSDGEKVYIRRTKEYAEIARNRNTCTFLAYTRRSRKSRGLIGTVIGAAPQIARYQLNLQNGLAFQIE